MKLILAACAAYLACAAAIAGAKFACATTVCAPVVAPAAMARAAPHACAAVSDGSIAAAAAFDGFIAAFVAVTVEEIRWRQNVENQVQRGIHYN